MSFVLKIKDAVSGRPYEVKGLREQDGERQLSSWYGVPLAMPLQLKRKKDKDTDWWLLPCDPYITVSGSNIVIKRNVAKAKNTGSIKERWSQDDYNITIEGMLLTPNSSLYPKRDLVRLQMLCEADEPIDVNCPMFEALGITSICIEDFDFPYTSGEAVQEFTIKARSDKDWQLLIQENKDVFQH